MEYSYLYEFNKPRYKRMAERNLVCKSQLETTTVENGFLLPNRYAPQRLFGHGGVLDADCNYVKVSEMNAYAKYAVTPEESDEIEIYMGEGYEINPETAAYIEDEVVYLGYINNHWGHFLLDATTRLYSFLQNSDKNYKYAYLVNEGQEYVPGASIVRFFELLGISDNLIFINKVTKCKKIIIPEPGYMINAYYSQEFLSVFDKIAAGVDCSKYPAYKKVYYSRANLKKAQGSEIGEATLLEVFKKNDFTIVSPEKCSLDEQIAIIRNAELLAGIVGTLPHNLLFAKQGQKMLVINKTHNLNIAQMDINIMRQVDMIYVDSYLAKFPVLGGEGPFLLTYSEELNSYLNANHFKILSTEDLEKEDKKKSGQIYEMRYRLKHIRDLALHYPKDERLYDYFAPEHVLQYEEALYHMVSPIKATEKMKVFGQRVERVLKRILKK